MTYQRKTKDVFELQVNYGYGHGWESEVSEDSYKEIRERAKEYRLNCPEYPVRIVRKREALH